ncbi:unnamed protein product [Phaedon cochleariae]|uniref:cyclin-dependent kinase n=1 Tax=Phaedon cochleariae TaxID=80249 RepID=A0A9P0GUL6_PHACE|nr:unnamed protein product [Phaedon cochleariae]
MSGRGSADEQSEDGELQQSPIDPKRKQEEETMDFSLSEEDAENDESLDIKPPQARSTTQSSRPKKKGHERRGRSDRHREERHSHREKRHREKSGRSKDPYKREKERYYREKHFEQLNFEGSFEKGHRERKDEQPRSKRSESHKHETKITKEMRDPRYSRDTDKHKHDQYEEAKRNKADKALHDLRERLLSKRSNKGDEEGHGKSRSSLHKDRKHKGHDDLLHGEAGMLVKEIINITTEEKRHRKDREEDKLTEEDKAEQDHRREKLLEAEREMERLKEQSRVERQRRHLEKASKRKTAEEDANAKRVKADEPPVVTVSDNSDVETDEVFEPNTYESDRSPGGAERASFSERSAASSASEAEHSPYSERRSRTRSRSRSRSASGSRSGSERSRSESPSRDDDEEMMREDKDSDKKDGDKPKPKVDESLPPYYPAVQGCRSVEEFQCLNRIEEGTYGVVYRARDKRTEDIVALKRLKMEKEKEGFPITSLREINTLLKGQHPNIVTVREIVVGSNMDKIFIVMDYVEHDLKSLMETMRHKKQHFMPGEIKCLLRQLLRAVAHLHDNWILHRDLKTSNLLLSHKGILKVGDFGLAREYGSPLKGYTPIVVTLWYRAPELLLCAKEYSTPIDLWSVGCIFAELVQMNALFPGKSEVDQLNRIFKDLGTPSEKIWPGFNQLPAVKKMKFNEYPISNLRGKFNTLSEIGLGMLIKFLTYDPAQRVTAEKAMEHGYFTEPPLPIDPAMFPTWPAKSELGQKRALAASPKPPSGGGEYKKLGKDGDEDGYGFRIGMGVDRGRGGPGFSLKF